MNTTELYRIIEQKERKITSLKQENGNLLIKLRDEKQLLIQRVSQQRELLKAWDKWDENNCYKLRHLNLQQRIDVFIEAFNCG